MKKKAHRPMISFRDLTVKIAEEGHAGDFSIYDYTYNAARDQIITALKSGFLSAYGFHGTSRTSPENYGWANAVYEGHSSRTKKIPSHVWDECTMEHWASLVKYPRGEFRSVQIPVDDARRVWPEVFQEPDEGAARSSRGRRPEYPEPDFFALCAWEANANNLPDRQADLVRRMDQLLPYIWGEDKTPGETWLKQKVKKLYDLRTAYELARQQAPGDGIGDHRKPLRHK